MTHHPVNPKLSDPFSIEELRVAYRYAKSEKATGADGIPSEVGKFTLFEELLPRLCSFFNACLMTGLVPSELKDVLLIMRHKSGPRDECDNFRGLSLINSTGKLLEALIFLRLRDALSVSLAALTVWWVSTIPQHYRCYLHLSFAFQLGLGTQHTTVQALR